MRCFVVYQLARLDSEEFLIFIENGLGEEICEEMMWLWGILWRFGDFFIGCGGYWVKWKKQDDIVKIVTKWLDRLPLANYFYNEKIVPTIDWYLSAVMARKGAFL